MSNECRNLFLRGNTTQCEHFILHIAFIFGDSFLSQAAGVVTTNWYKDEFPTFRLGLVGLQCVTVVFPDHTHLLFRITESIVNTTLCSSNFHFSKNKLSS